MKTAKALANIAVLALTAAFIPVAGAQQATQQQAPAQKSATPQKAAAPKPAAPKAAAVKGPAANAKQVPAHNPEASPASQAKAQKAPAAKAPKGPAKAANAQTSVAKVQRPVIAPGAGGAAPAGASAPRAESAEPVVTRRDPFSPLVYVAREGGSSGDHLPPGKAGLVVATVRVDGAVQSQNGMIAVLVNPQQRVYFVHEGDRLYDGAVEKISLDGVTFKESSKDAFGKPVERLVTKRIYPSAGEQQ